MPLPIISDLASNLVPSVVKDTAISLGLDFDNIGRTRGGSNQTIFGASTPTIRDDPETKGFRTRGNIVMISEEELRKPYVRYFKEAKISYYKYLIVADSAKEFNDLVHKLLKYENKFIYIKFEYNIPYKVDGQFRNNAYLATDSLSLSQVYAITNSVKAMKLKKLKSDPFYADINPMTSYSGKTKTSSI